MNLLSVIKFAGGIGIKNIVGNAVSSFTPSDAGRIMKICNRIGGIGISIAVSRSVDKALDETVKDAEKKIDELRQKIEEEKQKIKDREKKKEE